MIAFKLFRVTKTGLAPLFINKRQRLEIGKTYQAENHPTVGFAIRPGWHCCHSQSAPHLSKKGRVWCKVEIQDFTTHVRPEKQGGVWYTANKLTIIEQLQG